jgi:hypothetical protein
MPGAKIKPLMYAYTGDNKPAYFSLTIVYHESIFFFGFAGHALCRLRAAKIF